MTLNGYLVKSTIVAALGGLLFGFDTAVIAGTTHALTETYHLSPGTLGLTVAARCGEPSSAPCSPASPATAWAAATACA